VRRIESYLQEEEIAPPTTNLDPNCRVRIGFRNATVSWVDVPSDDEDDDDDDYSEDALKKIKEDSFAAAGSDSEKEQQGQQSAQQQEATSAANTITFSAAIGPILAACGILINYLI